MCLLARPGGASSGHSRRAAGGFFRALEKRMQATNSKPTRTLRPGKRPSPSAKKGSEGLRAYFRDMADHSTLNAPQEARLAQEIEQRHAPSRIQQRVVVAHQPDREAARVERNRQPDERCSGCDEPGAGELPAHIRINCAH